MSKIFKSLLIAGIVAISGYGVGKGISDDTSLDTLTLGNVEALAINESVCISSSSGNDGTCRARIDGKGDVCVTAGFWDSKNCSK